MPAGCLEQKADSTGASDACPLTTCVVSGEKLDGMRESHGIIHEGVTVKFCCTDCVPEFNKDPANSVAKVKAAGN